VTSRSHDRASPASTPRRRTSFNVRFWAIRPYKGKRRTTYAIRWAVAGREFHKAYGTKAHAQSRQAELRAAAARGEAFDIETGLPVAELAKLSVRSWFQHAVEYVDRRWDRLSGNSRQSIAETLATVTPALLTTNRGRPDSQVLRAALYGWAFNKQRRLGSEPPEEIAQALRWAEIHTRPISDLADTDLMLDVLDAIGRRLDGKPAAANTVARKRAVLHNLLEHAVGRGLATNPLPAAAMKWTRVKTTEVVDPQVVVNRRQADALLAKVGEQGGLGPRLIAFFGCMYYAGLRPSEAIELREANLELPRDDGWGTLYLRKSAPAVGKAWTDSGTRRERRQLKHRATEEVRPVPCHPALTRQLHNHIGEFGVAPDGRLFRGSGGGDLSESISGRVWAAARTAALTESEAQSSLAKRPYDLRHACLSTWLNAGVDPTQVAEWAGNSVAVLLRVYAKCIAGRDEIARQRIGEALSNDD
jgi:integrase